jgi:hypothetical protein
MASKDILSHAYKCAIIAGSIIGANVNVYNYMEWYNKNKREFTFSDFMMTSVCGAGLGGMIGVVSPFLVPAGIIGLPSYVMSLKNKTPK